MLEGKQLDRLFQILNMTNERLQDVQSKFLNVFNESSHIFKASFTLNHLININLLTSKQRIISIFLLIQNYKSQGIKKHPFSHSILNISQFTVQAFQRRMIADLIINSNRQKYLNSTIQALYQDEIVNDVLQEQRNQIKILREQLKMQLPYISQVKMRQTYKQAASTMTNNRKKRPPQQDQVNQHNIKSQLNLNYQTIGNLRPIPQFLEVYSSELNWISPGIITDASWDSSAQIQKKILKAKQLIKKGMQTALTKQENTQIQKTLQNQVNGILYMDIYPQNLNPLIRYNPQTVAMFLIKLSNYPIFGIYLDTLINLEVSLNIIEVITKILKFSHLPIQFFELFVYKNLKLFMKVLSNDQIRLMRIFSNFVRVLLKNRLLKTEKIRVELEGLMIKYSEFDQIQKLRLVINQETQQD